MMDKITVGYCHHGKNKDATVLNLPCVNLVASAHISRKTTTPTEQLAGSCTWAPERMEFSTVGTPSDRLAHELF
jgi:hypothetical protein